MAKKCLVICPFGEEGSAIRERSDQIFDAFIKPTVTAEGYDETYRLIDDAQPGSIGNQMIQDLYNADLVIADLTNLNPNVFYELALRHSVAKPLIHIADDTGNIPFDIYGISVIKIRTDFVGGNKFIRDLRDQIQKINRGEGHFENPASELRPICNITEKIEGESAVKVYKWEMKYTKSLAVDWLSLQEESLRKCVENFDKENITPDRTAYRKGVAEYLAYKLAQNTRLFGDLYYFIDNGNNTFNGWGNFKLQGSSDPLAISIEGEDKKENSDQEIIINFSQPSRKIDLAMGVQEEIRAFYYSIVFKKDAREHRRYHGNLYHPDFDNLLVCDCRLILCYCSRG